MISFMAGNAADSFLRPTAAPEKIVDKRQSNETYYLMKFSLSSVRLGLLDLSRAAWM